MLISMTMMIIIFTVIVMVMIFGRFNDDGGGERWCRWLPIPVAEWSKARVCVRSPAGVAGSNPACGMDVCVVCFK